MANDCQWIINLINSNKQAAVFMNKSLKHSFNQFVQKNLFIQELKHHYCSFVWNQVGDPYFLFYEYVLDWIYWIWTRLISHTVMLQHLKHQSCTSSQNVHSTLLCSIDLCIDHSMSEPSEMMWRLDALSVHRLSEDMCCQIYVSL